MSYDTCCGVDLVAALVSKPDHADFCESTDSRGVSQDTAAAPHPPLLCLRPTTREKLLATDHVVSLTPNFFTHPKTMVKRLRSQCWCLL
jgi:hypothetical protein